MKVNIPTPLRSYTGQARVIEASGQSIGEVLAEIDRRFAGFRFRIIDEQDQVRAHIKIFVNEDLVKDLRAAIGPRDTVHIICALSGG